MKLTCTHSKELIDITMDNTSAGGWTKYTYRCRWCGELFETLFRVSGNTHFYLNTMENINTLGVSHE